MSYDSSFQALKSGIREIEEDNNELLRVLAGLIAEARGKSTWNEPAEIIEDWINTLDSDVVDDIYDIVAQIENEEARI
jgi:hypothetical protein